MTLSRRRFLTISAAASFLASSAAASVQRWQGRALGADVGLTLHGPAEVTGPALQTVVATLREVERQFSLYDPGSQLSILNRDGHLAAPDPRFLALMHQADTIHARTDGLFDPTVQPLWRAYATGGDVAAARQALGWSRVRFDESLIHLEEGQALTFNGIAQGFATDLVVQELRRAGLEKALVNIGEHRGLGGPWTLGISDPGAGYLGTLTLNDSAIATSSPSALSLGPAAHILHGEALPCWSTVSVEADTATQADGFSTAFALAPLAQIERLRADAGVRRVTLIDSDGNLRSLR